MSDATTLLEAARRGDAKAAGQAFGLLYEDLRHLAAATSCSTGCSPGSWLRPRTTRVHEALEVLEKADPRLAQVVEMRFFGGLSEPEIVEVPGLSERTVRCDWEKARLLLLAAMS